MTSTITSSISAADQNKTKTSSTFVKNTSSLLKIIAAPFTSIASLFSSIKKTSDQEANKIFQATKTYYIAQVDNKPKTNAWATRALVILIYSGILAGIVGIGALLPHLGVDPKYGIEGISKGFSLGLISAGGISTLALGALFIASKINSKEKLSEYYKDFLRKRSDWFVESNLNDFFGGLAFGLLAISLMVHISPHLASVLNTTQGCLNYPFGALLILSGSYQLFESLKELNNARQLGDKEKIIKQWVNIFNSFLIGGIGFTALFGILNNPYAIGVNFLNGFISLSLAIYIFYKGSYKTLIELYKIDKNDPKTILNYLNNTLKLNDKEITDIKNELSKKYNSKKSIIDWINQKQKYFDETKKAQWKEIKAKLEQIEEKESNKVKIEKEIKEIQKLIIRIEIEKTIESKLDDFRGLVDEKTFKDTLDIISKPSPTDEELKVLFESINSQIKTKIKFEILKTIMYAGFAFISATTLYSQKTGKLLMSNSTYDIVSALLCFLSFRVGLSPSFRNIPPALEKQPFDINEKFEKENYLSKIITNLSNLTPVAKKASKTAQVIINQKAA